LEKLILISEKLEDTLFTLFILFKKTCHCFSFVMVNFSSKIPSIPFPNNVPLEIVLKTISSFFNVFEGCIVELQPNTPKRKST